MYFFFLLVFKGEGIVGGNDVGWLLGTTSTEGEFNWYIGVGLFVGLDCVVMGVLFF